MGELLMGDGSSDSEKTITDQPECEPLGEHDAIEIRRMSLRQLLDLAKQTSRALAQ